MNITKKELKKFIKWQQEEYRKPYQTSPSEQAEDYLMSHTPKPTPSTHSEVGEMSEENLMGTAEQWLRENSKRKTVLGTITPTPKGAFMGGYRLAEEHLTPTKPVVDVNHLALMLKNVLKGNDKFKVEFDNQEDNMNFILDICNEFKQQLINESYE